MPKPPFPEGLIVFFRIMAENNSLARSPHPAGREVHYEQEALCFKVLDEEGTLLGIYPADFVAAILPIQTIGPAADANNFSK